MTHPSEKKDQTDALEKALVNDADTHRDPSASETAKTGGMDPHFYPLAYRLACHAGDDIHPRHQAIMREAATKLAEVEREREEAREQVETMKQMREDDDAADAIIDGNVAKWVEAFEVNNGKQAERITILESRLQHSEAVRAELAEALDLSVATLDSITQSQSGLSTVHASIVGSAALARHRAAMSEKEEAQS